jgi:hypothetical protein
MAAPRDHDVAAIPPAQRAEYLVRPQGDGWIIARNGDEYGPYESRHDAMFFAVDAAHKLGERRRRPAGGSVDPWHRSLSPVLFLDAP